MNEFPNFCKKKKKLNHLADSTMFNHRENSLFNDFNLSFDRKNNPAMTMKELKMVHRNQTILTGGLMAHYDSDNSESFPFDFNRFAGEQQFSKPFEPMELEQGGHQRSSCAAAIGLSLRSEFAAADKDTEMRPIEIMPRNSVTAPVRPTTLHLTGPRIVYFRLSSYE